MIDIKIVYIFLLFYLSFTILSDNTIKVSFDYHNIPPYAVIENNKLVGGLIKDIFDELQRRVDIKVIYVRVPRARQIDKLLDGSIDILSIMNPKWLEGKADLVYWSPKLFSQRSVFFYKKEGWVDINSINDLYGLRVGCIRGYHYGILSPYFEKGSIIMVSNSNLDNNLKMLNAGRLDAILDSEILLRYRVKDLARYTISPFIPLTNDIYFAYSPISHINRDLLNREIQKLVDEGFIENLLDKYMK